MRLPGFTAGAALYVSDCPYYVHTADSFAGGARLLPQNGSYPPGTVYEDPCVRAYNICLYYGALNQYDPTGWCDWWHANCLPPAPPFTGGGGGGDGGGGSGGGHKVI